MTDGVLVDANVLIDIATNDSQWSNWSAAALTQAARGGRLVINPIIYAEVSVAFDRIEVLDDLLPQTIFHREALPWEAAVAGWRPARFRESDRRFTVSSSMLCVYYDCK